MDYRDRKLVHVLHYLMANCGEAVCDKVHLLKLAWMADRYHLRKYGSAMTDGFYCAYPHGPVNQHAYDILKQTDSGEQGDYAEFFTSIAPSSDAEKTRYRTVGPLDYVCLSDSNLESLDAALAKSAELSREGVDLSEFSHRFKEWQNVSSGIDEGSGRFPRISLADFFLPPDDPKDEFCLDVPDELVRFNRELVVEG